MYYYVTPCGPITPPQCQECLVKERGRVRGIAFVKDDFVFADITDAAEWNVGILAGNIFVVPETRGAVTISPVETEGFGDTKQSVDGYDYEINGVDPVYTSAQCTFWNDIKKANNFKIAYKTENFVHLSDNTVSTAAPPPVEDDLNSNVMHNFIIKFSQVDAVCPQDAPGGIFECNE
jgi:hypothetical protein